MMKRDKDGYIISRLPSTAVFLKGLERLVIPVDGGFPEYTPEAYNAVLRFFKGLGFRAEIDNLNDSEWNELTKDFKVLELKGLGKIASAGESAEITAKISCELKKFKASELYERQVKELTVLDVCVEADGAAVHVEMPYCLIDQICNS